MTDFLKHKIGGIFFDVCFVATICTVANCYSPLQVLFILMKPVVDIQNGALPKHTALSYWETSKLSVGFLLSS